MLPHNSMSFRTRKTIWSFALLCVALTLSHYLPAQTPGPANPHTPSAEKKGREYTINVDVNLVVLHATVLDKKVTSQTTSSPKTSRFTKTARFKSFQYSATPTSL